MFRASLSNRLQRAEVLGSVNQPVIFTVRKGEDVVFWRDQPPQRQGLIQDLSDSENCDRDQIPDPRDDEEP